MKASEIKVGGVYLAKVSGKIVPVRVDQTGESFNRSGSSRTVYHVTNLTTNRRTIFRSAAKFRGVADPFAKSVEGSRRIGATPSAPTTAEECTGNESAQPTPIADNEGEQSPDPTDSESQQRSIEESTEPMPDAKPILANSSTDSAATLPKAGTVEGTSLAAKLRANAGNSGPKADSIPAPHLLIIARAGTGKTTTLVEGLKLVKGIPSTLNPSPQQQNIWRAMCEGPKPSSVCFVAFNKSIATELQSRVPSGCDAMTMHSLGFRACTQQFGRLEPNGWVIRDILADILGMDCREMLKEKPVVVKAVEDLVSLCKVNLSDTDPESLAALASYYEIDLNGSRGEVFELVPRVLQECKDPSRRKKIMFDDMIWLPVVLGLPVRRYDLLLVDEAQDLNRCQQALAKKAGDRLVLCGDDRQAIYGFAGADCESLPRMAGELSGDPRGCTTLPLTVTRRCGKAIVAEARKYVPDFEVHESNPEGKIGTAVYPDQRTSGQLSDGKPQLRKLRPDEEAREYSKLVQDGDFVLCRVNAPLVSQCFRFLKAGRKANIQGRDVGQGLVSTIKKVCVLKDLRLAGTLPVVDLIQGISKWLDDQYEKEQAKKNPSDSKIIALQDRHDCILAFTEDASTVGDVLTKIEKVFTDDKTSPGIKLSSIHKAKGLESRRVFFLMPKGGECPHPMAKSEWQRDQEVNLLYVGITRAIEELIYVR